MRKPLLLAAVVVLLMTACRAEANFTLDVNEDGSGIVGAELGLDDELLELVEQFGGGTEELFQLVPEGQDVETRREGDMTFYSAESAFTDEADLQRTAGVFEGADVVFAQLELTVDDGGAILDARIEAPDSGDTLEGLGAGIEGLTEDIFSSNLYVTLPGELEESNADEVMPDGRLRWEVPLLGGTVDIHAVTTEGGSGISIAVILAIAAAVLIVGGALVWSRRQREGAVAAIESAPQPEAPSPIFEDRAENPPQPPSDPVR